VDKEVAYQVKIELLKRQLAEKEKETKEASAKRVEGVYDFCLEDHPNGHCLSGENTEEANYMGNNYNPGWSKHPNLCWDQIGNQAQSGTPQPRKSSPLQELLNKFANMSKTNFDSIQDTVANQGETIKSLETQIRQLSKLVTTHVSKDIAGNRMDNPKEECKALKEKEIERAKDEDELLQFKKWFNQLGITLEEAYDEFIRNLEEYEDEVELAFEVMEHIKPTFPPKKKDPGSVTIICQIGKKVVKAFYDIGSCVNVIPLSLAKRFKLKEPTAGTKKELVMADQTIVHSKGTIKDVLVKVEDLVFPADFMILDIEEGEAHPIILGRTDTQKGRSTKAHQNPQRQ
jgi:hypothetical protein